LLSHKEKGGEKNYSLIKPLESLTMIREESEEIHNQLSKLENQFNKLSDRSMKNVDLINTQRKIQKMDKNMEDMETNMHQKMEQLQNSMVDMLLHTLDERFPKHDIGTRGNHENRDKKIVEPWPHMGNIFKNINKMKIQF
jgi:uncharacterized protein with gpF-like domain